MGVSVYWPRCTACVCVCVIKLQYLKNHIMYLTSVNLMPCCIKHTSQSFGMKIPRLDMCRSVSEYGRVFNVKNIFEIFVFEIIILLNLCSCKTFQCLIYESNDFELF